MQTSCEAHQEWKRKEKLCPSVEGKRVTTPQGGRVAHGAANQSQLECQQSKGGVMAGDIHRKNSYLCLLMDVLLYSKSLGELWKTFITH